MRAGDLKHRITIQEKEVTRGTAGGEDITWTAVATVWAAAEPIRGREYTALRAAQSEVTIRFRIRYRSDVDTAMRVLWKSVAYEIVEAINVNAENEELQLLCAGPANG